MSRREREALAAARGALTGDVLEAAGDAFHVARNHRNANTSQAMLAAFEVALPRILAALAALKHEERA